MKVSDLNKLFQVFPRRRVPIVSLSFPSFCVYLEERTDIHVEAQIGEARGDDFGTTVVTVLTHFSHQDAGTATLNSHQLVNLSLKKTYCFTSSPF